MGTRNTLHQTLEEVLGSGNVYFQPPETIELKYPCIIYELAGQDTPRADNRIWQRFMYYKLIYITRDAYDAAPLQHWNPYNFETDSEISMVLDRLSELPYCSMGTPYTADNLYHYPFTIYC